MKPKQLHPNSLTRFLFDTVPVRGLHLQLHDTWKNITCHRPYPQRIRSLVGELTVAAVLLASNLKFDGKLILQMQGNGPLKMVVAEATSEGTCRATARWDEGTIVDEQMGLQDLLGDQGLFVMTLQAHSGEPWQGIVALEGDSVAQMLSNYMAKSEQLDTYIQIATHDECVSGLLLQRLPEQFVEMDAWETICILANTLTEAELTSLSVHQLLSRLFYEYPIRLFDPYNIDFSCNCSRKKVEDMLLLLGPAEVGSVIEEQGSIQVNCDFCHQSYVFDEDDAAALFGQSVVNGGVEEQITH